jgi:hypothetical protein
MNIVAGAYILIIAMTGSGKAVTTVPFADKKACEAAISKMELQAMEKHWNTLSNWAFTVCVPQGSEIP